jgi:hypothetical protein
MGLKQIPNLLEESGACWIHLAEVVVASIVSDRRNVGSKVLARSSPEDLLQLIQVSDQSRFGFAV